MNFLRIKNNNKKITSRKNGIWRKIFFMKQGGGGDNMYDIAPGAKENNREACNLFSCSETDMQGKTEKRFPLRN